MTEDLPLMFRSIEELLELDGYKVDMSIEYVPEWPTNYEIDYNNTPKSFTANLENAKDMKNPLIVTYTPIEVMMFFSGNNIPGSCLIKFDIDSKKFSIMDVYGPGLFDLEKRLEKIANKYGFSYVESETVKFVREHYQNKTPK